MAGQGGKGACSKVKRRGGNRFPDSAAESHDYPRQAVTGAGPRVKRRGEIRYPLRVHEINMYHAKR